MKKMAIVDKKGLEYIPNIDRMIREKEVSGSPEPY